MAKTAGLRIRRAEAADIPAVMEIESECFSNPWPLKHFYSELSLEFSHFFLVEEDTPSSTILGFIIFWVFGRVAELHNVAVKKVRQGQGIARQLISCMLVEIANHVDEVWLEVRASNARAVRLYEKFGFTLQGRRKNYYQRPDEDALVYELKIKKIPESP